MNSKKKYLATIFIIFIISMFIFAMVSTTSIAKTEFTKDNIKNFSCKMPENYGNGYVAGESIGLTVNTEIDVTNIDEGAELYFKAIWGNIDYQQYVYIIYRGG